MAENLTAQQRAQLFAMSTRQNMHMLAKETALTTPATLTFTLPKNRLLSNILLRLKGTLSANSNGTTVILNEQVDKFSFYRAVRRVSLDLNNGFAPLVLSGEECLMYNMLDLHPSITDKGQGADSYVYYPDELNVTPSGTDIDFGITLNIPVTLNERDPIGLILLQSSETNVTCTIDLGTGSEMVSHENVTAELKNVSVSAELTTFSIPTNAAAYPDLSVLKLVNGRKDSMPTMGTQVIKLTTGQIYRKLIMRVLDEFGKPMELEDINSNIELVFNQADTNYSISPEMLRLLNQKQLGYEMPKGMFFLDFSNAGSFVNYGGARDYIDTSKLNEMWLKFTTTKKGKVEIVTECISRLV